MPGFTAVRPAGKNNMDFCRGLKLVFLDLDLQPGGARLDEEEDRRQEGNNRKEEKSDERTEWKHVGIGMEEDVWVRRRGEQIEGKVGETGEGSKGCKERKGLQGAAMLHFGYKAP